MLKILKNNKRRENAPSVNDRIRATKLQVITHTGENLGVIPKADALRIAQEANLDLVLIAESGGLGEPVAKIMDFGKNLYEKKKKQQQQKKNQKEIQIKEVKMRPKIGEHDYETKINQAIKFLGEGKRLKITLTFRGRERATKRERGQMLFDKITATLSARDLLDSLIIENGSTEGAFWSKFYMLKSSK
jgi:translation initiation factor IF-3